MSIDDDAAFGLVLQKEIALFRESRDGMDVTIGNPINSYELIHITHIVTGRYGYRIYINTVSFVQTVSTAESPMKF